MANKETAKQIWETMKSGSPSNQVVGSGDRKQLDDAKKMLESQEKLRGIEVAKW
jgi:hypothetical protein